MTRNELIAALEKAPWRSNVLDGHIFLLVLPDFGKKPWRRIGHRFWDDSDESGQNYVDAPHYTDSIDAALTLVPDGFMWFLGHLDPSDMRFVATLSHGTVGSLTYRGAHKSAAIALCIAALKARP